MSGHTPGPWEIDTIDNDGEYGSGPDSHRGFKSYAVYDANGRCLFDSLNRDGAVSEICEEYDEDGIHAWDEPAKHDLTLAAAAPDLLEVVATLLIAREQVNGVMLVDENSPLIDAARVAIRKATGES
jgi:hypothetical protein